MPGEAEAFPAVTVLIAVLEQAIERLGMLEPALDGELIERAEHLRDLCMVEIRYGRFAPQGADTPRPR